jgi:ATP-binding cassette subfamily F protein uup
VVVPPSSGQVRKASYKERRELEELPERIERLEDEQRRLAAEVAGAGFYKRSAAEIQATMARLAVLPDELLSAYARWNELDGLR